MDIFKYICKKLFVITFALTLFIAKNSLATEEKIQDIADQITIISEDLKTLEKAVYKSSDITSNTSTNSLNEDILTKHLLKLNEIESQFRDLTNRFEEVNFKLDKLSSRVTKIQSDAQLRFRDLETGQTTSNISENKISNIYK